MPPAESRSSGSSTGASDVLIVEREASGRWLLEGDTLDGGSAMRGLTAQVDAIFVGIVRESSEHNE